MRKFPKEIFVQHFVEEDGNWLVANASDDEAWDADIGAANAGERVAIYRLVEIVRLEETQPRFRRVKAK